MLSYLLLLTTITITFTTTTASDLQSQLDTIVDTHALYWNTSLSMAFAFSHDNGKDGFFLDIFASAAGTNDRFGKGGDSITTKSRIPSGSTDKAFTSAAILRSAELGLLDLDSPAFTYIDPWLAKQTPPIPCLLKQWKGNPVINTVTVRMLLSMRSGIQDYDDGALFKWTLAHPNEDYLPEMFLSTVNKTFAFAPDHGGLYSGTGYVMLGMILSSVQNASSWDKIDQMAPLLSSSASSSDGWKLALNETQFMMQGKCNQYPDVTHQYIYGNQPYSFATDQTLQTTLVTSIQSSNDTSSTSTQTCGGKNYPSTTLLGTAASTFPMPDADSCCSTIAAKGGPGVYWQYDGTNCTAFSSVYKGNTKSGYTAGQTDGPFDPTKVRL